MQSECSSLSEQNVICSKRKEKQDEQGHSSR